MIHDSSKTTPGAQCHRWAPDSGSDTIDIFRQPPHMTNRKGKSQTTTSEMEVTVLRVEPIAASVFEIPPGFTETAVIPPGMGGESEGAVGPMRRFKGMFGKKKKKDGGR